MKIQIQKSLIESALAKSIPFLDTKDSSKVVSNVQIVAKDGLVTISATDYDMGITTTLNDIFIITDGEVIANGKKLLDTIKVLKNDMIDIELKGSILHINQGKSKFKVPVLDDIFPTFPSYDATIKVNIDTHTMIEALRKITPSIDINNPKYELNGALIDIKKDSVNFVSTDTKRLSFLSMKNENENEFSIIIPKRAVVEIQKLFFDDVEMFCIDTFLLIKSDRFSFYTRLINGKFPDVMRVIPKTCNHTLEINKMEMIENIKQIVSMSQEIKFTFNGNTVSLQSITTDTNEAKTEFDIESSISEEIISNLQSKYILDFLNTILADTFTIKINDGHMPIVLESDDLMTIVMPIVV